MGSYVYVHVSIYLYISFLCTCICNAYIYIYCTIFTYIYIYYTSYIHIVSVQEFIVHFAKLPGKDKLCRSKSRPVEWWLPDSRTPTAPPSHHPSSRALHARGLQRLWNTVKYGWRTTDSIWWRRKPKVLWVSPQNRIINQGFFQRSFAAAQRSAKLEASPCPGAPDRVSGQSQSSQTTKSLRWATAGKCHQAYLCSKARGSKNLCRYKDI